MILKEKESTMSNNNIPTAREIVNAVDEGRLDDAVNMFQQADANKQHLVMTIFKEALDGLGIISIIDMERIFALDPDDKE